MTSRNEFVMDSVQNLFFNNSFIKRMNQTTTKTETGKKSIENHNWRVSNTHQLEFLSNQGSRAESAFDQI